VAAPPVLSAHQVSIEPLPPTIRGASDRVAELQAVVAELEAAVSAQRRIGVVIGIFAARYRCDTDRAWEMVAELSHRTDVDVGDLTSIVLDLFDGGVVDQVDADLPKVLAARLRDRADRGRAVSSGSAGDPSPGAARQVRDASILGWFRP
jgi:hypothetical protein